MSFLSRLAQTSKTILAIIGLPLLAAALGYGQLQRAPDDQANATQTEAARQVLDGLTKVKNRQAVSADGPDGLFYTVPLYGEDQRFDNLNQPNAPVVLVMGPNGRAMGLEMLIYQAQQQITATQSSSSWSKTLRWLAAGAFVCGLLGAAAGALFLVLIRSMGRKALKSRSALLKSFRNGKVMLPWFVGAAGVLFLLSISSAVSFEAAWFFQYDHLSNNVVKLLMFVLAFAAICVYMGLQLVWRLYKVSRAAFQIAPMTLSGRIVSESEAPKLWAFVRDVAGRVQAETPEVIVAGLDKCFFVTECPAVLNNGEVLRAGRKLYLPLPYMAFMSKREAAAVIGHELAHFTGDDTEYSQHFAPIYASAVNHLITVDSVRRRADMWEWMTKPMMTMGVFFLRSFDEAVKHWSRRRELAADAMGARVAGRVAMALVLIRLAALAPRVNEALGNCWRGGNQSGGGQDGGNQGGVLAETRRLVREKGLEDPRNHLDKEQAHPTDTHPTTGQRLDALKVSLSPQLFSLAQDPQGDGLLQELGLEGSGEALAQAGAGQAGPVSAALEAEFSASARKGRKEVIGALRTLASRGTETIAFFESGVLASVMAVVMGCGLTALNLFPPGLIAGINWMLGICGLFVAMFGFHLLLRRRKPFLTLTAEGPVFANLQEPLPWTAVVNISARPMPNSKVVSSLTLLLADDFTPPPFSGDGRVKFNRKHREIVFSIMGLNGYRNPDTFSELLISYWRGGHARAELKKYAS